MKGWDRRLRRIKERLAERTAAQRIWLRFGKLKRLPPGYAGERHVIVAQHLPDRSGQRWVEYEEVVGPAPVSSGPPGNHRYLGDSWELDIVFVSPYPAREAAGTETVDA